MGDLRERVIKFFLTHPGAKLEKKKKRVRSKERKKKKKERSKEKKL